MNIGTSKVTTKGQLTIPNDIRKKQGLKDGMTVVIIDTEAGILIKKASDLREVFLPFEEIATKEGLTRSKLSKEIKAERAKTME